MFHRSFLLPPYDVILYGGFFNVHRQTIQIMLTALIIYLTGCYVCGVALHGSDENRELPTFVRIGVILSSWLGAVSIIFPYYMLEPRSQFYWKEVETWWPGNWFPSRYYIQLWTLLLSPALPAQGVSLEWWCANESWNEWAYNRPEEELHAPLPCLLNVNYGCESRIDTFKPFYFIIVDTSVLNWQPTVREEPYHATDYTSTPPDWGSKFFRSRGEFYLDFGITDMQVSALYYPLIIVYDGGVEWSFIQGQKNEWFQGGTGNLLTYQYFNGVTPQQVVDELLCEAMPPWE